MFTIKSIDNGPLDEGTAVSATGLIEDFLTLSRDYKNSYFWTGNWNAYEQDKMEKHDNLSFELDVDGTEVEAHFSVRYSRHHVYVSKKVYVDGSLKDIRALKKVLKIMEAEIKEPLDAATASTTRGKDLIALAHDPHVEVIWALVARDDLPQKAIAVLANRPEAWCRKMAAKRTDTPLTILRMLSKDANESVLKAVAQNSATPESALKRLAKNNDPFIRELVAKHPNTTDQDLCRLAADPDRAVRLAIARRSGAPSDVLLKLSEDKDKEIRLTVAGNESTPIQALEHLSKARGKYIPLAVARNSAISHDLLLQLTAHQIADVRAAAQEVLRSRDAADLEC